MKLSFTKITASLAILGLLAGTAYSHKGATGIVKERMDVMAGIGKNMKEIGAMMNGKAEFDGAMMSKKAGEISEHSAEFPKFFMKPVEDQHTEAAPAIWEKPEEFKKQAEELTAFAKQLSQDAADAKDPQAVEASFKQLANTCKTCHESFRIKK